MLWAGLRLNSSWRGIGFVVVGMARHGFQVSLGDHGPGQWIAVFYRGRGGQEPITGGVVGALFGMGGPPYVAYIAGRVSDPAAQRATIAHMVILNVGLRVVAFAWAGFLLSRALWITVAMLLPVAWTGVWIGHQPHIRVAAPTVARTIGTVLFASGAALIIRTL